MLELESNEADGQEGSPPDTTGEPQAVAATETEAGADQSTGAERAPDAVETQVDPDALAFERLRAGEDPDEIRQNPQAVAPSLDSGSDSNAKQTDATASPYGDADAKQIDTLRRAQMLPAPEDWAALSQKTRAGLVAGAKRILADAGRRGQQLGQKAGKADAPTNQDDTLDPEGEAEQQGEDADGTVDDPPRYTAAEWQQQLQEQRQAASQAGQRGVRAQTAATPARAEPQTPDLQEVLRPVREMLGDDVAGPLAAILTQQQQALAQAQDTARQQGEQLQRQFAEQLNVVARQMFQPQEREAFKSLEAKTGPITAPQRQTILATAFEFSKASSQAGEQLDWRDAVERAGRAVLSPNIEQKAQQDLLDRRTRSLRATPTKAGATVARPDRALSKDDRDARAFALLEQKRSPGEVREALY